jgi:broad specificity phosphatase PhoE
MRLIIVRHADPDYATDSLTADGKLQAAALARRLGHAHVRRRPFIACVYTSPMGRAQETARYIARELDLPLQIETWTQELVTWRASASNAGASDTAPAAGQGGRALWDMDAALVRSRCRSTTGALPDHESQWKLVPGLDDKIRSDFQALVMNSDAFLARHGYTREPNGVYRLTEVDAAVARAQGTAGRDAAVVVVCHGGFGLTWLAYLLELPLALFWNAFWLAPSSVTTILFETRSPTTAVPRCLALGDVGHLLVAGLPEAVPNRYEKPHGDRPSGLKANWF